MDKLTRRNFIFGISKFGIVTCTIDLFLEQLIYGKLNSLLAQETSSATKNTNYIGLYIPGGPPRWMFDCPLEEDGFISSPGVGTVLIQDSGQIVPSYQLSSGLPKVWDSLSDLHKKAVFIRGVESLPIHSNNYLQFFPQSSMPGVHAFSSIQNTIYPLPSVQWENDFSLNHPDKKSSAIIYDKLSNSVEADSEAAQNIMEKIISPFSSKNVRSINSEMQIKIDNALDVFKKMGRAYKIDSDLLHAEIKSAKDLINGNLESLLSNPDEFSASFNAYGDAIKVFRTSTIAGIDNIDGSAVIYSDSYSENKGLWSGAGGYSPNTTNSLKSYYENAFNDTLQLSLAMAEFVIKNGLSNSLLLSAGNLEGISTNGSKSTDNRLANDAHSVGGIVSTVFFTKYFQGIGLGINKFIERLSGITTDDYIIHLASEFGRSALASGAGSDHGTNSSVHTIISSKIESNQVIGEVTAESDESSSYYGSWGKASTAISLKQVHSSICHLMGLDTNVYSFYEEPLISTGSSS